MSAATRGRTPDGRDRGDESQKMARMEAWLDEVCAELRLDRSLLAEVTPELLRLVGRVAHGPSRPGAPLTAFALGLAAGGARPAPEDIRARAAALGALAEHHVWLDSGDDGALRGGPGGGEGR